MKGYFDSHAHMHSRDFAKDRETLLNGMADAEISYILNATENMEASRAGIALAERYDFIYTTVGTHPHDVKDLRLEHLKEYEEMTAHPKVVAIGEIGLDFYRDLSPRDVQRQAFRDQLDIAVKTGFPVVIHTRDATLATYEILKEYEGKVSGVMHCYSESAEMAERFLELGYYISLAGPVTYANARKQKEVAATVPLDKLLIETDSPYLTPQPKRGKRNDPRNVIFVAKEIAKIRGISVEEVRDQTRENALRAFRIEE